MLTITFKELRDLIAQIDCANEDTYPIKFYVKYKGDKIKFESGITNNFEVDGEAFGKQQYLSITESFLRHEHIAYLQDPNIISYDEIERLMKIYGADENAKIYLYDKSSFSGKRKNIKEKNVTEDFKAKVMETHTQSKLTEEVQKGLNYFKEILQENIVLISTKEGEYTNLNNMSGSSFSFLLDRKVLYYDTLTSTLCTYCPYLYKFKREFLKRIETNDNFKWIMLYICNGEDLLSSVRPCFISIRYGDEEKRIDGINANKLKQTFEKIYNDLENKTMPKEDVKKLFDKVVKAY